MGIRLPWTLAGSLVVVGALAALRKILSKQRGGNVAVVDELQDARSQGEEVQLPVFFRQDYEEQMDDHEAQDGQDEHQIQCHCNTSEDESDEANGYASRSAGKEETSNAGLPTDAEGYQYKEDRDSHTYNQGMLEEIATTEDSPMKENILNQEKCEILKLWRAKQEALEQVRALDVEVIFFLEKILQLEESRKLLVREKIEAQLQLEAASQEIQKLKRELQMLRGCSSEASDSFSLSSSQIGTLQMSKDPEEGLEKAYIRNAILMAFKKNILPAQSTMFNLLAGLLDFSAQDLEDTTEHARQPASLAKGLRSFQAAFRRFKKT